MVFGHTLFREVKRNPDKIGIDTDACYADPGYGKLTAFVYRHERRFKWNKYQGFA